MDEQTTRSRSRALPLDLAELGEGPPQDESAPLVSVVFGSASDWPTMEATVAMLDAFGVPSEHGVVSAHRTPDRLAEYARGARSRGVKIIIGAAGGAAHLPGMIAAWTTLPVLGVPIKSRALNGVDSLLSIVQMPGGVPVGTLAIGDAGAKNAALLAIRMLSVSDASLEQRLSTYYDEQGQRALATPLEP